MGKSEGQRERNHSALALSVWNDQPRLGGARFGTSSLVARELWGKSLAKVNTLLTFLRAQVAFGSALPDHGCTRQLVARGSLCGSGTVRSGEGGQHLEADSIGGGSWPHRVASDSCHQGKPLCNPFLSENFDFSL